jgi:adenine-specific DNA methylase
VPGCNPGESDEDLRKALFKFIGDFANWDLAGNNTYLGVGRALLKAAYAESNDAYESPVVVDPFAGGGSIPLEALRVGCEAFAGDLNPVACVILKLLLEDFPRYGPSLGEEIRREGEELRRKAQAGLANFFPNDSDGAIPIAYLWARTIRCESPNCGAEVPLVRSFWLSKKAKGLRALAPRVTRKTKDTSVPSIGFEIIEPTSASFAAGGTVSKARCTCLACGGVMGPDRIRAQLTAQRGGGEVQFDAKGRRTGGALMLAVVLSRSTDPGRSYRLPNNRDYEIVWQADRELASRTEKTVPGSMSLVPDEPIPRERVWKNNPIRVHHYGMARWGDLFTRRQALTLSTLVEHLRTARPADERGKAVNRALAIAVSRQADYQSTLCSWHLTGEKIGHTFGRQALPMVWDFAEVNPFSGKSGGFDGAINWVAQVATQTPRQLSPGQVTLADATATGIPSEAVTAMVTDPPYYDAVPYAKLANFFYMWLKRSLGASHPELFRAETIDGRDECVVDEARGQDRGYFESKLTAALQEGRRVVRSDGVACVVFAHKTTEGWEALLSGFIRAGWIVTASWPIQTEMGARLRAMNSAALGASIHLICRPRADDGLVGDWADVLRELPKRVDEWMERLQGEGVHGADLVFACIGPALEIFSRYAKVETADGREVKLDEYLQKVWEVVGRSALAQILGTAEARARNGAAGAVEEDARLTALFLWTLQATEQGSAPNNFSSEEEEELQVNGTDEGDDTAGTNADGFTLVFDVVRRFAQPLGIDLPKWEGRVIDVKKGLVRLLPIAERAKQLFGTDGAEAVATRLEEDAAMGTRPQLALFPDDAVSAPVFRGRTRGRHVGRDAPDGDLTSGRVATTLDRVHAAMLLQAGGRTNALRALLKSEQEHGPDFLRLANALSALYPKASEEKRLVDAMLLAVPR